MDNTTSETTSPSGMEYSSINDGMTHSQATRHHFLQGEASQQRRQGGRRLGMTIEERKARKRQTDARHRQQKKAKFDEMTALNKSLQDENGRLSSENRHLKVEIEGLRGKGQLPQDVLQTHDSYISQPPRQIELNVSVQNHYGTESNIDERVYNSHQYMEYTPIEEAANVFDGLGIDELLSGLPLGDEMTPNGRFPIHESATEHPTSSQSGLCPVEAAQIKLHNFLTALDADVKSNVDPSDFTGLEGEQRSFRRFRIPLSLIPTAETIEKIYGDVSATSLISPSFSEKIYIFFCATIKEMGCLHLGEVTERIMLKWRDVIKDALRLNFDVTFAMEHLKKIARAYFGLTEHLLLQDIGAKISTLEAQMKELKEKQARMYEKSRMSIDAAEKFIGVPISTGLFPTSSSNRIMHCRN